MKRIELAEKRRGFGPLLRYIAKRQIIAPAANVIRLMKNGRFVRRMHFSEHVKDRCFSSAERSAFFFGWKIGVFPRLEDRCFSSAGRSVFFFGRKIGAFPRPKDQCFYSAV